MKTNTAVFCFYAFFLFCMDAKAEKSQEQLSFREAKGEVAQTTGRSWSNFTVGSFKLEWNGGTDKVTLIGIQHFQFCVVPPEQMKFEDITDPTQFLYRSMEQKREISQSTRERAKKYANFPTSPQLPVKMGSTLMLTNGKKCLAFLPLENVRYSSFEELPANMQDYYRRNPGEKFENYGKSKCLRYVARLWQNVVVDKDANNIEFEVDEATGIRTATIAPMADFFLPEIGNRLVFVWHTNVNFHPRNIPETRKELYREFYQGWSTMNFDSYLKGVSTNCSITGTSLESVDNPFSNKFEAVEFGPGVSIGLPFPSPTKLRRICFIRIGNICVGIELMKVSDKEIVFRWKPFSEEKTQVAQRATAKIE